MKYKEVDEIVVREKEIVLRSRFLPSVSFKRENTNLNVFSGVDTVEDYFDTNAGARQVVISGAMGCSITQVGDITEINCKKRED